MQENCVEELSRLIQEDGYKAVRFNPYLWPKGETMTNERGRAMYKRCVPVPTTLPTHLERWPVMQHGCAMTGR